VCVYIYMCVIQTKIYMAFFVFLCLVLHALIGNCSEVWLFTGIACSPTLCHRVFRKHKLSPEDKSLAVNPVLCQTQLTIVN